MSNTKTVMGQASNQYVAPTDITDVFSTYLYDGTGSAQTITNGIDLAGEGGLIITKRRNSSSGGGPWWNDTERGVDNYVQSSATTGQNTSSGSMSGVTSSGYTLGTFTGWNNSAGEYVSWTFRKTPKFFTCVQYTGDGVAGRTVSHNLGTTVGTIIVKRTDTTREWGIYHRSLGGTKYLSFDTDASASAVGFWNNTEPTSTEFTVGASNTTNASGGTYVAYLFAHNDGDGGFGPSGDQDIIKCGSFTSTSSTQEIDLGFEPQWVMFKNSTDTQYGEWRIFDTMRGMSETESKYLAANLSDSEATNNPLVTAYSQGFKTDVSAGGSGKTYIYMAIRRGPLASPTAGTEVFAMDTLGATTPNPPSYNAGFPVDLGIMKSKTSGTDFWRVGARLTGEKRLRTDSTDAEATDTQHKFDYQDGWYDAGSYVDSQYQSWMWKRAPSFCDVVAYTGNGTAGRTVSHNLGVAPEMMWIKSRNNARSWRVYHSSFTNGSVSINSAASKDTSTNYFSTPTADNIILGSDNDTNRTAYTYIAYLFSTLAGISKVGSYTGNGSSQTIDCGFTTGARFILIKRTDATGDWFVFDTERGIVSGNDPSLALNNANAQRTTEDSVDPNSSGFIVVNDAQNELNVSNSNYIFYAIA
jgi:hypothetical protein